jgi:hypothetical protein
MNPHNPNLPNLPGVLVRPPTRPRVFRDPVHGDITFPRGPFQRLLESLIDTELFQRLRGIRQSTRASRTPWVRLMWPA